MSSSFNTLADVDAWGKRIVAAYDPIALWRMGVEPVLKDAAKNKRKPGEWLLFCELTPIKYADPGGNPLVTLELPLLLCRNTPQSWEEKMDAVNEADLMFRDIFLRNRTELKQADHLFDLDELEVMPVIDRDYGVGGSCQITVQDHIPLAGRPGVWNDGYTYED